MALAVGMGGVWCWGAGGGAGRWGAAEGVGGGGWGRGGGRGVDVAEFLSLLLSL